MTYEQRSELRKECSKFLRFSYLIDFIGLEALRTIYKESVEELLLEIEDLVKVTEPLIYKDKNVRPANKNHKEPIFYIQVEFNFNEVDPINMITVPLPEFIPPPIGNHTFRDFHILYHIHLINPQPEGLSPSSS